MHAYIHTSKYIHTCRPRPKGCLFILRGTRIRMHFACLWWSTFEFIRRSVGPFETHFLILRLKASSHTNSFVCSPSPVLRLFRAREKRLLHTAYTLQISSKCRYAPGQVLYSTLYTGYCILMCQVETSTPGGSKIHLWTLTWRSNGHYYFDCSA